MKSKFVALGAAGLVAAGLSACAPAQTGMGPMAPPPPAPVMMDHSREGGAHGYMPPMAPSNPADALSGRPTVAPTGAIRPGGASPSAP
jgi:hypothetical protein